jgi:hypothetical protein
MSDHSVRVVRINEILVHPNADKLSIVPIGGFQVVAGKGQYKPGDLAIYIPPDSIVPERPEYSFVWEKDGQGNPRNLALGEPIPEKYRRITVKRLRKEYSEGLLMPTIEPYRDTLNGIDFYKPVDFALLRDGNGKQIQVVEGEDVAEFLGITHWNPPDDSEEESTPTRSIKQSKILPRSLKGWIYFLAYWFSFTLYNPWGNLGGSNEEAPLNTPPIYDVENLKNHPSALELGPDEHIVITEKIHGSNARFIYQKSSWSNGHLYAGSRKLWKRQGNSIWRQAIKDNPDIELWCSNFPGYTLYGEVVPTQGGFDYGCESGKTKVFFFDILTPDREWLPYLEARRITETFDLEWCPCLFQGRIADLKQFVDGPTLTHGKHIREGIVVRVQPEKIVRGLGRAQVKIISNAYYEKSGE